MSSATLLIHSLIQGSSASAIRTLLRVSQPGIAVTIRVQAPLPYPRLTSTDCSPLTLTNGRCRHFHVLLCSGSLLNLLSPQARRHVHEPLHETTQKAVASFRLLRPPLNSVGEGNFDQRH